jgi:predicted GNAT family N-acyltransferase
MSIAVKKVSTITEKEECLAIRRSVFINEQNISEKIEFDDLSVKSINFIATFNDRFVGTARYRETDEGIKLERFAVLKKYRSNGVGKALLKSILARLKLKSNIYLHAQRPVVNFYKKLGFKEVGNLFYEAGIPHMKLIKK